MQLIYNGQNYQKKKRKERTKNVHMNYFDELKIQLQTFFSHHTH
jgi:hypothetical protein